METLTFPIDAYRERIGIGAGPSSAGYLHDIHEAQSLRIPFENLDVVTGRGIRLDMQSLVSKLIERPRGGYCFELNSLLSHALEASGFTVERVLARVMYGRELPGPRTHLALIVNADGIRWLADAGFGGPGLRHPIRLEANTEQRVADETFRLIEAPHSEYVLQKRQNEEWLNLYSFALTPVYQWDLEMSNFYTSTHPKSMFRQKIICTRATTDGRVSLHGNELSVRQASGTDQQTIDLEKELGLVLHGHFGIQLDMDPATLAIGAPITLRITA